MSTIKLINIGSVVTFNSETQDMEIIVDSEIVIEDARITEIGKNLPSADKIIDCKNNLVTPGFVDSHTHPVFFESRDDEFLRRLSGETYEMIKNSGGGIVKSIQGVRDTSELDLINLVKKRMDRFLKLGTTTIEAKSGYGLNIESELKSLKVLDIVQNHHEIDIIPTFMGAHSFPPEYIGKENDYVDLICDDMIPRVAKQGIAKFNDVFCENGYFTVNQARKILESGLNYGLIPRIHAEEFSSFGSAQLAAELKLLSADHLMAVSAKGIKEMSKNNVIATLLPGTTFCLGKSEYAPYKELSEAGVVIAIATDFNPGSCFIQSMSFIIGLACLYLKMPILEALKASTYNAAKSLGLQKNIGSIELGKNADLIIWEFNKFEYIFTQAHEQPINLVIKNGEPVIKS